MAGWRIFESMDPTVPTMKRMTRAGRNPNCFLSSNYHGLDGDFDENHQAPGNEKGTQAQADENLHNVTTPLTHRAGSQQSQARHHDQTPPRSASLPAPMDRPSPPWQPTPRHHLHRTGTGPTHRRPDRIKCPPCPLSWKPTCTLLRRGQTGSAPVQPANDAV